MESYIGTVLIWAGSYAPRQWSFCNGQLLAIAQYQAVYSILGDRYGGDGRTTVGLPDLRGRVPIGAGQSPGLSPREPGQRIGLEFHSLSEEELAAHSHEATFTPSSAPTTARHTALTRGANADVPSEGSYIAAGAGLQIFGEKGGLGQQEVGLGGLSVETARGGTVAVADTGEGLPFSILQPSLVMEFIIWLDGLFPPRN